MTVEILYIVLAVIFGILCYFGYIIEKQKREMDSVWKQILILTATTAQKIVDLKRDIKEIKKDDKK